MVMHSLTKSAIFFAVGTVAQRRDVTSGVAGFQVP